MENIGIVPVVAIAISVGTFFVQAFSFRHKAEVDYVNILEKRVDDLERRMKECEDTRNDLAKKNQELVQQNTDLLKRIVEEAVIGKIKKGTT